MWVGDGIEHDVDEVCEFGWKVWRHFGVYVFIVEFLGSFVNDVVDCVVDCVVGFWEGTTSALYFGHGGSIKYININFIIVTAKLYCHSYIHQIMFRSLRFMTYNGANIGLG